MNIFVILSNVLILSVYRSCAYGRNTFDEVDNLNLNEEQEDNMDNEVMNDIVDIEQYKDGASYSDDASCDPRCGKAPWHIAGKCIKSTGRCRCFYGWTGPNSKYISKSENIIEADYCMDACHYSHDSRNPHCTYKSKHNIGPKKSCHPLCSLDIYHKAGTCLSNGRCLCWWGWTGPSAVYIRHGKWKNRILADFCTMPCHFTHDHINPYCATRHINRHG